jgi:hypothetical protein
MKKLLEFAQTVEKGKVVLPERPSYDQVKIVLRSRLPLEVKIKMLKRYKWNEYSTSKAQSLMVKKVMSYFTSLRSREERIAGILGFLETLPGFLKEDIIDEIKKLGTEDRSVILFFHPELVK